MVSGTDADASEHISPQPWTGRQAAFYCRDVTRYLCAAVHMNSRLAMRAVELIIFEPYRVLAHSPGVHLAVVLRHAVAARRRHALRDLLLGFLLLYFIGAALNSRRNAAALMALCVALSWFVVWVEALVVHRKVLPKLNYERFDSNSAPRVWGAAKARMRKISGLEDMGVTAFAGLSPFIGFGTPFRVSSFTVDTTRHAEGAESQPEEVRINDLYAHVRDRLGTMTFPATHVRCTDRIVVTGSDAVFGNEFIDDPGIVVDDPDHVDAPDSIDVTRYLRDPDRPPFWAAIPDGLDTGREITSESMRPYLVVEVIGWGGEIVTTLFLRFARTEPHGLLFVEVNMLALAPMKGSFHDADHFVSGSELARRSFWLIPWYMLFSLPSVLSYALGPIRRTSKQARQFNAISRLDFNYGSLLSVREAVSDHRHERHFQKIDREMHIKALEYLVVDALVDFLDARGIDTGDLVERKTAINNNTLIIGGDATFSNSAVSLGAAAKAVIISLRDTVQGGQRDKK